MDMKNNYSPCDFVWKARDNQPKPLTREQFLSFLDGMDVKMTTEKVRLHDAQSEVYKIQHASTASCATTPTLSPLACTALISTISTAKSSRTSCATKAPMLHGLGAKNALEMRLSVLRESRWKRICSMAKASIRITTS